MIVRAGSAFALTPGLQTGPLVPARIPTVEGRERFGGNRPTGGAGVFGGGRRPIGLSAANFMYRPRRRGVRGLGANIEYCSYNPPDAGTQAAIAAAGNTYSLIPCAAGATTNPANPGGTFQNNPNAMQGPQPVQSLPSPPQYEDCTQYGLASEAAAACTQRNLAKQQTWQTQYAIAQGAYNNAMCKWNGQPASYCDTIYPPGQPGAMAISTPVPIPLTSYGPLPIAPAAPTYNPVLKWTGGASLNVGDSWTVSISGATPNAVVSVTSVQNGQASSTSPLGSTDANGNFSLSGTMPANSAGSWSEQWMVGGQKVGALNFTVNQPSGGGSAPSTTIGGGAGSAGGSVSGGGSTGGATVTTTTPAGTFDLGSFLSGSMLDGIPNWALIGVPLVALFVLPMFTGGRR